MRWRDRWAAPVALLLLASGCARPLADSVLTPARAGWTRSGRLRRFTPDNLFEYINGEADFVIPFGFRSLTHTAYRRGDAESTVDIYDMGTVDGAFGLFRSRAHVDAAPVAVGTEGVADEARVEFWQGARYVAVSVPAGGGPQDVLPLARSVADDLPPTEAWPAYLGLLPPERRIARSEQYTPASFLGQQALVRAVSARYTLPGGEATLFACRCDTAEEAAAAGAQFRAYVAKQAPTRPLALGDGGWVGKDEFLGAIAAFRRGRFVGGIVSYVRGAAADGLLAELDQRLAKQ